MTILTNGSASVGAHEQRLEEAEEELSEMQDRPDVLGAELLAKEQVRGNGNPL